MAIIGGRALSIKQIHEIGKLGYSGAEISLYDPDQIEAEHEELLDVKAQYGLSSLTHYPNEGNSVDVANLRNHFVPRMKRLFELSAAMGATKGTFFFEKG